MIRSSQTCSNCYFGSQDKTQTCLRYPTSTPWPLLQWCGEWNADEQTTLTEIEATLPLQKPSAVID